MIIVIADDLTGAAEIAGIGHSYGLSTALISTPSESLPVCDLIVIATDTRSMSEADAVRETHSICQQIKAALPRLTLARQAAMTPLQRAQALAHPNETLHIFKKTDSALRGHVHLELRALVEESRYEQVMYVPANPSKGRTIRGGRYFIDGTPIDQTAFKRDPEFPIVTANVADAIGVHPGSRLRIADAEDAADIQRAVKQALTHPTPTMLAGGADLFTAFLTQIGHKPSRHKAFPGLSERGMALIVCGSTQSTDISTRPYVRRHYMSVVPIPQEVFQAVTTSAIDVKQATERWMGRIKQTQLVSGKASSYILTIPYASTNTRQGAVNLRQVTAEMCHRIVAQSQLTELIIEGGATAYSAMRALGWTRFKITQQVAPGVIRMQCLDATHTHLTIKPGSYDWGNLFD